MLCNKRSHRDENVEHPNQEYPPLTALEKPTCSNEDPVQPKINKTKNFKYVVEEEMKAIQSEMEVVRGQMQAVQAEMVAQKSELEGIQNEQAIQKQALTNEQGNMIINVEFNQTLSSERKLLEKNSIPYSNNILMIYID